MILPRLFSSEANLIAGSSYSLSDVIDLRITEERNGAFDLEMQYLYDGENAERIVIDAIIFAVPQRGASEEPFRIYDRTIPINGVLTVRAHHLCYDLDGVYIEPFRKTGITSVLSELNTQLSAQNTLFQIQNNGIVNSASQMSISYPQSLWSLIGGSHSLVSIFGGELQYRWDDSLKKEIVVLNASRGKDSLATVAYGVNIVSLADKTNSDGVYSAIYPFVKVNENDVTVIVNLPEKTVNTGAVTSRTRVALVDLSSAFQDKPTVAELRAVAHEVAPRYAASQKTLSFDFVPLQNTTEEYSAKEEMTLCDIVTVHANNIGIEQKEKVVKTVFNPLSEKYEIVTAGEIEETITDVVAGLSGNSASSISPTLKYYDESSGSNYTIGSGNYVRVNVPNSLSGHKILAITVLYWSSNSGAFTLMPYGADTDTYWYILGARGTTINGLRVRFWYV